MRLITICSVLLFCSLSVTSYGEHFKPSQSEHNPVPSCNVPGKLLVVRVGCLIAESKFSPAFRSLAYSQPFFRVSGGYLLIMVSSAFSAMRHRAIKFCCVDLVIRSRGDLYSMYSNADPMAYQPLLALECLLWTSIT